MTTTRSALCEADIRQLIRGTEPEERALVAHRLCRHIDRTNLTDEERQEAHEILRLIARDAAEQVRRALAVTLKASPMVPRDVVMRLAEDLESIAVPVLSCSPVFSDEDLAEIVRLGSPVRACAVARRPTLSRTVTGAISKFADVEAVRTACLNPGADFSESGLSTAIDRFEKAESVLAAIMLRKALPASVTERLISLVSDELRTRLIASGEVAPEVAQRIAAGARERATVDLVDEAASADDLPGFVAHLRVSGRLTPSLLLRAMANGNVAFLEWGLAELAGVPHHRTWLMVHDAGRLGLKAICERAGVPGRLLPAFRAAVDAYHSLSFDDVDHEPERFRRRMLERFLTQAQPISREDLDYFLDKIDQIDAREGMDGAGAQEQAAA